MKVQRAILVAAVLLTAIVGAGCMGPEEDPADTVTETETTPGETVEAGATPTEVPGTTTVGETAEEDEAGEADGEENGETGDETETESE